MTDAPRGIDPQTLLSQVKNTMPYLFARETADTPLGRLVPSEVMRDFAAHPDRPQSHFEYFRLCLSSHYLSCATPVPTDVDNQIRFKLWPARLPLEVALEMAHLVLESRHWDFTLLSRRAVFGPTGTPCENSSLTAHGGEWFTVATGAYCALKRYCDAAASEQREEILSDIADEVTKQSEIFGALWRGADGLSSLRAAVNIAHNFGDLDRVMDIWELPVDDPLRLRFYKLGIKPFDAEGKLRYLGRLWVAGELYKSMIDGSSMALENHRHFALRKPRCLRQRPEFLIPIGPFFDDWGRQVARALVGSKGAEDEGGGEALAEVVDALKHGWERLPKTLGYGRALRAIAEAHPEQPLPALPKSDPRRAALALPQQSFEKRWNDEALKLMDDIPSRA